MPPAMNSQGAGAFQSSDMPCTRTTAKAMMPSTMAPDRKENAAAATGRPRPRANCELIGAWMAMKAPDRMPSRDQTAPIIVMPLLDVGRDLQRHDLVGILHRLAALDLIDILHAFDDLAPHGVLAIEEGGVVEADEELRIRRVRVLGARHRASTAAVIGVGELGLEVRLVGAAHARARRRIGRLRGVAELDVAGLRHEAVD